MKNMTLTTVAAMLLATTANAAEIEVNDNFSLHINGTFQLTTAISTSDPKHVKVQQSSMLMFRPTVTLDNGVQIIGDSVLTQEGFMPPQLMIRGNFGEFHLGSSHSAGSKLSVSPPNYSSADATSFMMFDGDTYRGTLTTTNIENRGNYTNRRISYYAPRMNGFKLGVSVADHEEIGGAVDLAVNYKQELKGYSMELSTRYGKMIETNSDVLGVGAKVAYNGFEIGGSYAQQTGAEYQDGSSYDVGVGYAHGNFDYSVTYFNGNNMDNEFITKKESLESITGSVGYNVTENFRVNGFVSKVSFDDVNSSGNVADTLVGISTTFKF